MYQLVMGMKEKILKIKKKLGLEKNVELIFSSSEQEKVGFT